MCIIIVKQKDQELSEDKIQNSFENNSDGAGYMWNANGKVNIRKPFFEYKDFIESYKATLARNPEATFVLHFRITTHGAEDKMNTHPHRVTKRLAFAHNGIISGVGNDDDLSDTVLFSQKYLSRFKERDLFMRKEVIGLMEKFLSGSKIVLLNAEGKIKIYNESAGTWKDGLWFSNSSYSYSRTTTNYSGRYNSSSYLRGWEDDDEYDYGKKDYKPLQGAIRQGWKIEVGEKCYYCATSLASKDAKEYGLCDTCIETLLDDSPNKDFLLSDGNKLTVTPENGTQLDF